MPTANEQLQDALIRHAVGIQRYTAGQVNRIIRLLDRTIDDLEEQLTRRLMDIEGGRLRSAAVTQRLEQLLENIRVMRQAAYREAGRELTQELVEFGQYEAQFVARTIRDIAPVELALGTTATIEQVGEIVRSRPFQGLILRDWVADLADQELRGIKQAVNIGMAEGQSIPQIVRRVIGSKRAGIKGVLDTSRRHATTWVRTAVSHTANNTRDRFYDENSSVIKGVKWLSTLDTRTTALCIARDGHIYSIPDHKALDGGPPWLAGPGRLHPQCRSTSTPLLKSWKELGIDLDEAPEGTRASMNGQVPSKVNYRQWLQRQPAAVQDEVLGKTRALAMRRGDLEWDEMFTPRGELRTLRELAISEQAA